MIKLLVWVTEAGTMDATTPANNRKIKMKSNIIAKGLGIFLFSSAVTTGFSADIMMIAINIASSTDLIA